MDRNSQIELESIKTELQSIIDELRDISYGVNRDFDGIGSERCSTSVQNAANHYVDVKSKLNRIDTTAVTEEFRAKQEAAKAAAAKASAPSTATPKKTSSTPPVSTNTTKATNTNTSKQSSKSSSTTKKKSNNVVDAIKGALSWLFK